MTFWQVNILEFTRDEANFTWFHLATFCCHMQKFLFTCDIFSKYYFKPENSQSRVKSQVSPHDIFVKTLLGSGVREKRGLQGPALRTGWLFSLHSGPRRTSTETDRTIDYPSPCQRTYNYRSLKIEHTRGERRAHKHSPANSSTWGRRLSCPLLLKRNSVHVSHKRRKRKNDTDKEMLYKGQARSCPPNRMKEWGLR